MLPLLNRYSEHYRGPANSYEYNQLRENIHFDITKLYNYAALNQARIYKNMDIIMTENYFLQNRLMELEQLLSDMEQYVSGEGNMRKLSATYGTHKQVRYSVEDVDLHIPIAQRMFVDTLNRHASIPPNFTQSRTTVDDLAGNKAIPVGLQMFVYEGTSVEDLQTQMDNVNAIEDPTIYHAFDGKRNTFWAYTSTRDNDVSELYIAVHIKLTEIDVINGIELHPFPEFALTLADVKYRNRAEPWTSVSTYPVEGEEQQEVHNATKTKFIFPTVYAGEILIYMKQPHYFIDNNQHIFMYGFQAIDVQHNEYSTEGASIISEYDLSQYGNLTYNVVELPQVKASIGSISNIDSLLSHQLYYEDTGGNVWPGTFGSSIPIGDCQKVYVMTTMTPRDNITPMIQSTQISFNTN